MNEVRLAVAAAARTEVSVMIVGEAGVGKEGLARRIHAESARADHAFTVVNCGAGCAGLAESEWLGYSHGVKDRDEGGPLLRADGGTVFLDDVGALSSRMQTALWWFTGTRASHLTARRAASCVDVRLMSATDHALWAEIAAGLFREDLYYRLNEILIHVPPLRDRREDVVVLCAQYLAHAAVVHGRSRPVLTPEAARLLLDYRWPGNLRELRTVTERLVLTTATNPVTADDLLALLRPAG